ncbi:MAG: 2-oxo acid dehydrogenase subunit E2 [Bacteroidales bacterium]|nr:MAG: 2-oxo acid dehydrogenase subunit E2 [Bacteroidales bacterium]
MAKVELLLPAMGEGVIEATITKWLVNEGDMIEEDDSIVEVATDKVDSEVPSPWNGKVEKLLLKEGDTPKIGEPLAIILTEVEEGGESLTIEAQEKVEKEVQRIKEDIEKSVKEKEEIDTVPKDMKSRTPGGKFLSPLVRSIAAKEGISHSELDEIRGTGSDGRITKDDLLLFISKGKVVPETVAPEPGTEEKEITATVTEKPKPVTPVSAGDEIIEMDRMRKLIAEHMVRSKQTSPHVTSFIEADVTNLVTWRNKVKDPFFAREKEKITFTPVFIEAAAMALKDFPMINVSVEGNNIIRKKKINIGMATALPNGNLIVPVIKDADEKSLLGMVKSVNDLANRARNNKLQPDEIVGGTFTITNFGTFQNITGTPIINQPEAAILGVGAIRKKPSVIETSLGDAIAIRHLMILSLSYDHRVIDGALGGMFLKRVAEYLEDFDMERTV